MSNLSLPIADKTNIKDWAFLELDLKEVSGEAKDTSEHAPTDAKNVIIVRDGALSTAIADSNISVSTAVDFTPKELNQLTELNAQKNNSNLYIQIAKNAVISEPIYIVYEGEERSLVHRTAITLETGAEAEIIETFASTSKINANIVGYTKIDTNAKLKMSVINRLNGKGVVYYHRHTEVSADAVLETTNFLLHDSNIVFEDFTHLVGKGADANVSTVALADGEQKQNITVRVENLAPRSIGNIVNYGVVKDDAHLAFNGIGKIHKDMKGVDNQQESRLLNLSLKAQAIANPFLLIDEGDITAGHAASIGQINPEQVYYLMSRGLSKQEAEKMIVSGFLAPFADIIQDEKLKEQLLESIELKLG